MKTEQAVLEFMVSRGGLRPKTKQEYLYHLEHFQQIHPMLPETPLPVQAWLNGLQRERGKISEPLAPETIHSRFRTLRAFYRQIHQWHPEVVNPMPLVRPPPLAKKAMRTFTGQELYRMFSQPLSLRDHAMAILFLDTGIRAQECANLVWEDVHPDYITVNGKTGERDVPINESTYRLLQRLKAEANHASHVFLGRRGPLKYEGVYKVIRRICRNAGLEGRRTSPHTFRHTFGTEYASTPGSDPKALQDIMGHTDFKTTLRYIHNNRKRLIVNHRLCSPLRLLPMAGQSSMFNKVLTEAESILASKNTNEANLPMQ